MPNGDIVSGCSDGFVRVFSASEERWASQEDLKSFDDQVASQALPKEQVGDVKKSDLPGLEALGTPGPCAGFDVRDHSSDRKQAARLEMLKWSGTVIMLRHIRYVHVLHIGMTDQPIFSGTPLL